MTENNAGTLDRALSLCSAILESSNPEVEKLTEHAEGNLDGSVKETRSTLSEYSDKEYVLGEETLEAENVVQLDTEQDTAFSNEIGETKADSTDASCDLKGVKYKSVTGIQSEGSISKYPDASDTVVRMDVDKDDQTVETLRKFSTEDENGHLLEELTSSRMELDNLRKCLATAERKLDKADNYNEVLRKMVESLSAQIHKYKMKANCIDSAIQVDVREFSRDTDIQLDEADFLQYTTGEMLMPDWGTPESQVHILSSKIHENAPMGDANPAVESMSIAESLKATAEAVVAEQAGFTFDAASGLYYDHNTGYYYDPNTQLYYDPTNCVYFYFDHESGKYTFHSQVSDDQSQSLTDGTKPKPSKSKSVVTEKPTVKRDPALVADKGKIVAKPTSPGKPSKSGKKIGIKKNQKSVAQLGIEQEPVAEKEFKNRKEKREALREEIEELTKLKEKLRKKHIKNRHSEKRRKHHRSDQSDSGDDRPRKQKHSHRKRRSDSPEYNSHGRKHRKHRKHKSSKTRKEKSKIKDETFEEIINLESDASVKCNMEDTCAVQLVIDDDDGVQHESIDHESEPEDTSIVSLPAQDRNNSALDSATDAATNAKHNVTGINDCVIRSKQKVMNEQLVENVKVNVCDEISVKQSICLNIPNNCNNAIVTDLHDTATEATSRTIVGDNKNQSDPASDNLLNNEAIVDENKTEYNYTSKNIGKGKSCSGSESEASDSQINLVDRITEEAMDIDDNSDQHGVDPLDQVLPVDDSTAGTADGVDDEEVLRNILYAKMAEFLDMQEQSDNFDDDKHTCDEMKDKDNSFCKTDVDADDGLYCDLDEPSLCDMNTNKVKKKFSETTEDHGQNSPPPRKERTNSNTRTRKHESDGKSDGKRRRRHSSRRVSDSLSDVESGELSSSESGELSDSSESSSEASDSSESLERDSDELMDEIATGTLLDEEEPEPDKQDEVSSNWPPCIRMIVTEAESIDVGMLFIVTCDGGTVGRNMDTNHAVWLNEPNVSKMHAEIRFVRDVGHYKVNDLGSQNGTFLNGRRVLQHDDIASSLSVSHGDVIEFGRTRLLCHIHPGGNTCDECEPGVVRAQHKAQQPHPGIQILSKSEKKTLHRKELKQIKHKYGLKDSAYVDNAAAINNPRYRDKADERRRTVGSDTPHLKQEAPASVHRPLSSGNVGHQMLKKMGWTEGESLGKDNKGIQEPVTVGFRANQSAGLGSATTATFSADDVNTVDVNKVSRRLKAQQRYNKLQASDTGDVAATHTRNKPWQQGDTIHPD